MVGLADSPIDVMSFPDGTPKISCERVFEPFILWKFNDMSEMFTVYCVTKHLRQNGANHIRLVMPYIPNARMDRVKNEQEKSFAKIADLMDTIKRFTSIIVFITVCKYLQIRRLAKTIPL